MKHLTHFMSHFLYCILLSLLVMVGCKERVELPDHQPIIIDDNLVSSLDSSLVHVEDKNTAIFLEDVTFSITPNQFDSLKELSFQIYPKLKNSIVDTFTVSYSKEHIVNELMYDAAKYQLTMPVFGLYDDYMNTVLIASKFTNGKKWEKTINIETKRFTLSDENNVKVAVPSTDLKYSYLYLNTEKGAMLMDIEGNIRWAAADILNSTTPVSVFLDNYFYCANRSNPYNNLIKVGLNGSIDTIAVNAGDYPGTFFHHEMGIGPKGLLIEVDVKDGKTQLKKSSILIEVDLHGKLIQTWDMDEIIGKCIAESNVPVTKFILNASNNYGIAMDWFHMNSSYYDKSDNSVIISSRENFVIKVGYEDKQIKWILGDTTKYWFTIDTLRHYAIELNKGSINVGQHCLTITENNDLLLFNNGDNSKVSYFPFDKLGIIYEKSMISSYKIDATKRKAEVTYQHIINLFSPARGSVQKDGRTYLISSLPVVPDYKSNINIFDDKGNTLLEIRNYSYFCNKVESFSPTIRY